MPAYPVKMGNGSSVHSTPAPDLGEHTIEVLKDVLNYSEENIQQYLDSGVVVRK